VRSPALLAASSRSIPMVVQSTSASSSANSTRHCTARSEAQSTGVVWPIGFPFLQRPVAAGTAAEANHSQRGASWSAGSKRAAPHGRRARAGHGPRRLLVRSG
jgi:hypothetical protein